MTHICVNEHDVPRLGYWLIACSVPSHYLNKWQLFVTLHWRHNERDSGTDQRKHQSSASLAFVRGIHRGPVNSHTNGQQRGKCFHLMTSSWIGLLGTHFCWMWVKMQKFPFKKWISKCRQQNIGRLFSPQYVKIICHSAMMDKRHPGSMPGDRRHRYAIGNIIYGLCSAMLH